MPFSEEHHRNGRGLVSELYPAVNRGDEFSEHLCDVCRKRVLSLFDYISKSGRRGHQECLEFDHKERRRRAEQHDA